VRAGQDRERFKNEGQSYANDVVPKARGVAARLIEEANGYRQSVISTAQGDASRFRQVLDAYEKAPGVTRERIYIETLEEILRSSTKVLVDTKGGNNLLYLPLDQLVQRRPLPPPADQPAATAAPPSTPSTGARPRDRDTR